MIRVDTLDELFTKLSRRTRRELSTLHFVAEGGTFTCLDLDVSAPTLPELKEICKSTLDGFPIGVPLPCAPKASWERIWNHNFESRRIIPGIKNPVSGHFVAAALIRL